MLFRSHAGFQVTGIDVDQSKVDAINRGESYIQDVPTEVLAPLVKAGKVRATTDFAAVRTLDTINICVPTPLRKTKDPDMSYIVNSCQEIAKYFHPGILVILESTTYPGTTAELMLPMFEKPGLQVGEDFFLCFSPERVDPEYRRLRAVALTPQRLAQEVTATDDELRELQAAVEDRYGPLPEPVDPITRVRGWSEMAHLVEVERQKLATEGKPVFIIGSHYGITSLISFYIPESRASVPKQPFVYYQSSEHADNQFYFWENYGARRGQNAIYAVLLRINGPDQPAPERLARVDGGRPGLRIHRRQLRVGDAGAGRRQRRSVEHDDRVAAHARRRTRCGKGAHRSVRGRLVRADAARRRLFRRSSGSGAAARPRNHLRPRGHRGGGGSGRGGLCRAAAGAADREQGQYKRHN